MPEFIATPAAGAVATPEKHVWQQVRLLLHGLFPQAAIGERRQNGRFPFPVLLQLTPVDGHTLEPLAEPLVIVGKNISEQGLGFYHQQPLPYRYAVVTLEDAARRRIALLIDLSWCRFTRFGWYDSGGRFLRVVQSLGTTPPEQEPR